MEKNTSPKGLWVWFFLFGWVFLFLFFSKLEGNKNLGD